MRHKIRNERGSALLMTLGVMGMLCIIAILAVENSTTDIELSFNNLNAEKAFYLAEAGAMHAYSEIQADSSWRTGFANVPFNDGVYSVRVIDSVTQPALVDTMIVVSSGELDGAVATVEVTLTPEWIYPFQYAMFGDDQVAIKNSMDIDSYNSDSGTYWGTRDTVGGDVGSNGVIYVHNGSFVGGDVATSLTDGDSVNPGATITGTVSDDAPEQEMPDIPASEFTWAESVSMAPAGLSGSFTYNSSTKKLSSTGTVTLNSGVYFFSDIVMSNTASMQLAPGAEVIIYITGDIEMKNSSEMNVGGDPADLLIFSQGDLVLKNSGDMACCFYSPDGTADFRNSGEFYGSVATDDIICHNSAKFHYDRNLSDIVTGTTGDILMVGFREI